MNTSITEISLISLDHLSQLIPAYAAWRQSGSKKPLLILSKPHIVFDATKLAHLQALVSHLPEVRIILGSSLFQYPKLMTYCPVRLRAIFLRRTLKQFCIVEIFYAHDISSDFWNQTLMQAFPEAKRICFGDALGLVYSNKYFTKLMYPINHKHHILLRNIFARIKRKLLIPSPKQQLLADEAILAIPCDPGGDFLKNCPFSIILQKNLQNWVLELAANLPAFQTHMQELVSQSQNPCTVLMLSNFTESKLTTLDNEIALYREILQEHCKKESILILKPHPAHKPEVLNTIIAALRQEYRIHIIEPAFTHLPMELAQSLVCSCNILSVSYSSISLAYIYQKKVAHVLTEALIKRYFSPEKQNWFRENNRLYLNMIQALQHWTKDHVLRLPPRHPDPEHSEGEGSPAIGTTSSLPRSGDPSPRLREGFGMTWGVKIGVIIVNYNSAGYLLKALQALSKQSYPPKQVIIFDNGSSEPIPELILALPLEIILIKHPHNIGFAAGNNKAIASLDPQINWIALLNPDAYPHEAWLAEMVLAIQQYPEYAFFGSKLISERAPHLLDGTGDVYHVSGKAWRLHHGKALSHASEKIEPLFSPCAAAALYRRDAFHAVQGFDESYFCYYEDVDLAFRLWLLGYQGAYVPQALAEHTGSVTTKRHSDFYTYHGHRNLVWTYCKNMPSGLFLVFLPLHICLNIATILLFIRRGQTSIILKAKWDALKGLKAIWKKRKIIQKTRVASSLQMLKLFRKGLPW